MGKKDLTEKILEDYNDVFADIVNVLLFDGECRVKEEDLENACVHSQYKASDNTLHEEERDTAKFWNNCNVRIALVGMENQTKPEKQMPLRIFGYEGASYREQLGNKDLYPVVTLVLYFGTKRWNYKKTLKELMDVPVYLKEYVNDIKINVFEISWLPDEVINKFTSDFKVVARFFAEKRKNKNYIPKDKTVIKHVDAVLKLLSAMTNDNRYESILATYTYKGKEVCTMCEVAERLEQNGILKGKAEGRAEGKAEGRAEGNAEGKAEVVKNMINAGLGLEDISRLTGIELSFVQEVAQNK